MALKNLLAARASRGLLVNVWLCVGNSLSAELLAAQDYDVVTVDFQHGLIDISTAVPMLQAIDERGKLPVVRVASLDVAGIAQALDAGACAIICPMIDTPDQARALVSMLRYPPYGVRSFGPIRAAIGVGPDYFRMADEAVAGLAMIETAEAMRNLDAIAATPGLGGLYVGSADLAISLSDGKLQPGTDWLEGEMAEALRHIARVAREHGLICGLHATQPEFAREAVGWGYDMVTLGTDTQFLAQAAAGAAKRFRDLL